MFSHFIPGCPARIWQTKITAIFFPHMWGLKVVWAIRQFACYTGCGFDDRKYCGSILVRVKRIVSSWNHPDSYQGPPELLLTGHRGFFIRQ